MTLRNAIVHFLMMNKRLYKKPAFLVTLCLIVVVTVLMVFGANGESGIVNITIYAENTNDTITSQVINELQEDKSIINYKFADTYKQAYDDVKNGKSDGSWIFADNMESDIEKFTENERFSKSFVEVIQRENSVFVNLANEKLYSVMHKYLSYSVYKNHMNEVLNVHNDSVIDEYYKENFFDDSLIEISYLNSNSSIEDKNYLLTPLRGMLSLLVILCSISSVMYFLNDKRKGVFNWINPKFHIILQGEYVLVSALNTAVFVLIALGFSGLFMSAFKEILLMLLYVLSCVGFCLLLCKICRKTAVIGSLLPGLMLIMLVLSPVFIVIPDLEFLKLIFPPYYYLNALYDNMYILYLFLYTVITYFVLGIINRLKYGK